MRRFCRLLKTMPGIGDFFAALIVAEVDDIDRFAGPKNFASYIGLAPRRDQSAQTERSGKMHKQGNTFLRWAFIEAAIPATRSNLALKDILAQKQNIEALSFLNSAWVSRAVSLGFRAGRFPCCYQGALRPEDSC